MKGLGFIIQKANLIVGTTNNNTAITMSVQKAAAALIKKGTEVSEEILNMIEMAFRAYDPCFSCATHSLPGHYPMQVTIVNADGEPIKVLTRE